MSSRIIVFAFFLFPFSGFPQDTLVLKIINMQSYYEPCLNHWFGCETLLLGKLTSGTDPNKTYRIHVSSTATLNLVAKNSSSIYRVILRKRFYKDPFEKSDKEESYSLIDIRSAF